MGLQREHLAVLQAISARDPDAARDAMRRHLFAAQQRYRRRLTYQQESYAAAAVPQTVSEPKSGPS
jgi:DNA-binding FadR family transcriptional regulator